MKAEIVRGVKAEMVTALEMEEINPEKAGKKINQGIAEVEDIAETERILESIEVSAERKNKEETVTIAKRGVEEEIVRDQQAENVPQIGGAPDGILGVTGARTGDELDLTVEEGDRAEGHIVIM